MSPENRADEVFMDLHRPLFESVLLSASGDEKRWAHRVKTFESSGLLDFQTASTLKPKPVIEQFVEDADGERMYLFGEKQLDQPRWKNRLIRKLKAPRPSKWMRYRLPLHRDKVSDPQYRQDIAKVLAFKWVGHLKPQDMDIMYMRLMDAEALEHCLDKFNLISLTPDNLNDYLLRRFANELLDKNEEFNALIARMQAEFVPIREQVMAEIREITAKYRAESQAAMDAIAEEARLRADTAIAEIQARAAVNKASYERFLAENASKSDEDPQVAFRRTVDASIARRNAAIKRLGRMRRRKPLGFMWWAASRLAILGIPVALAMFMEFGEDGTTIVEFAREYFGLSDNQQPE
ncbi:MAG: hypothetical protein SGJ27_27975 [Candidatus Melainabacteria bacterium]|nr:hypothetical protein [Candidatus Melainabacteria bacterium]